MVSHRSISAVSVPIIQEESHSHAPFRRGDDAVQHELAGEVGAKDIVLQVQGFFCPVDQTDPGEKGIFPGGQEVESRSPMILLHLGLNFFPHGGRFRQVKGGGEGAGVVIRDGGTPVQERKEQQKKREKDGPCRFAPFNHSYVCLY